MIAELFLHPLSLDGGGGTFWLMLPLCASVAITYKTIRVQNLRQMPLAVLALMGLMIVGLILLGVGLWLFQALFL